VVCAVSVDQTATIDDPATVHDINVLTVVAERELQGFRHRFATRDRSTPSRHGHGRTTEALTSPGSKSKTDTGTLDLTPALAEAASSLPRQERLTPMKPTRSLTPITRRKSPALSPSSPMNAKPVRWSKVYGAHRQRFQRGAAARHRQRSHPEGQSTEC